jgi:hypothetical protein
MSVLDRLASALGRNDERPNVELAQALASKPDEKAIAELVEALSAGTSAQQNDAIKVLYELGERAPDLVAPHAEAFLALLSSKNNRNVWGAMQALDAVAQQDPDAVFAALPQILAAADRGSVIAKDKAMSILTQLASVGLASQVMPIFLARLEGSAPNQFPMYAEFGALVMDEAHKDAFVSILLARVGKFAPAKRARVEKVLRKLSKS